MSTEDPQPLDPKTIQNAVINFQVAVNERWIRTTFAADALGAYNDVLALTPYTFQCKVHLLMKAADLVNGSLALGEQVSAEALLKTAGLRVSAYELGPFDPEKAYDNEMKHFQDAQRQLVRTHDPRRRRVLEIRLEDWKMDLRQKYHDKK